MIRQVARWCPGVIGLALLVVGAVKTVSVSSNSAGIVVVAGALLLVSPFIIGRIEKLSVGATGFELQLSQQISELGAPKTAQVLDRTELAKFAESYAFVHEELSDPEYGNAKVHLQDQLVERSAAISRREKLDATEVRTFFRNGSPMMRVLALGLMQGDPSLADGATIISALTDWRSGNEQRQGLRLAELSWRHLSRSDRQATQGVIKDCSYIPSGTDIKLLADQLLTLPAS